MSDADLLKAIMEKRNWTQQQLAEELLFDRSQVSRVINQKTKLRPAIRGKAEKLLEEEP